VRVLAIDQSVTATGYALFEENGDKLKLVTTGIIKAKGTGIYRFMNWCGLVSDLLKGSKVDLFCREVHHHMQFGAASQLQELAGALDRMAFEGGFLPMQRYVTVPASTWKKFVAGKGNLSKDSAYLIHINNALRRSPYIEWDATEVIINDNLADAICLGIAGYAASKVRTKINIPKNSPEAYLLKSLDVMFDYGKTS
jgi:Holliday junction resolvasome RuvABC endonuclease subunit